MPGQGVLQDRLLCIPPHLALADGWAEGQMPVARGELQIGGSM